MTAPTLREITVPERPGEPPSALPDDELIAIGSAFGSMDNKSAVLVNATGHESVTAAIVEWGDLRIRFRFPGGLGGPGPKEVRVRTRQGTSAPVSVALEEVRLSAAPVALLPLGLQTRFSPDGRELWVRAIPDTIHIDSHEQHLTAEEAELGRRYRDAGTRRDDVWLDLTTRFGVPRAEWIVRATLAGTVVVHEHPWTRAARSRLLPRRLHAFAYDDDGNLVASQHGRPIPFELPMGPDPGAPSDADPERDPGLAWMIDFAEALARGMAIKLRLPDPVPRPIARLVVLGVETALTPEQGARELGDALAAHRYTRGIGFLPEGTPTNVTPAVTNEPGDAARPAPPDVPAPLAADTNAGAAAHALGLTARSAELFAGTPHADGGAQLRGARRHMNAALWPATWGYFLEHMMAPVVPPAAIEPARLHFVDWVRGCGPQPVLRIGEQPYGLLPVLPLDRWKPQEHERPVEGLAAFLSGTLQPIWSASVRKVPRLPRRGDPAVAANPEASQEDLLTVLSMQPRSISFRGRSVLGMPFVEAAWRFIGSQLTTDEQLDEAWRTQRAILTRAVLEKHQLGNWHPYLEQTLFHAEDLDAGYFPLTIPLVQSAAAGALDTLAQDWLTTLHAAGWEALRRDWFDFDKERPLLYLLLRHSLLVAYLFAAGEQAPARPWRGGEEVLYGIDEAEDNPTAERPEMTWDLLTAPSAEDPARSKGDLLDIAPRAPLDAVRDGIAQLIDAPVKVLEHAAAETLDLCSHRLDAWISSFAQRRLDALRGANAAGGLHLGAYGVVEDIRQGDGSGSFGYVHAPSLAHASAAAILASGYRSHPEGTGHRRPFGIDLSSERVRVALSLLDGVRAGEQLGALLGYRLERSLHERGLARFIDDLRQVLQLPITGTAPPSNTAQAVGARNVVDALELHRQWVPERALPDELLGKFTAEVAEELQVELPPVLEEIDDAIDAIGDILLTEGVYQLARGNAERAAAALRAAAKPSATPPELEAIYTPHAGIATIHRLAVLLPGDAAPAAGWSPDPALARRAAAEPRLDAWAGRVLGDPKRVHYRVRYEAPASGAVLAEEERRLDQLMPAPSPLDVVYAAVASERTQLSELEQRIVYHATRTRPAGIPPDARVRVIDSREPELEGKIGLRELMELAQALRETIGGARSITPDDLSLPDAPGAAAVDATEVEARATAVATALGAAKDALGAAIAAADAAIAAADPAIAAPAGEALRAALLAASALGVLGAVPLAAIGDDPATLSDLKLQASVAQAEVRRRVAALDALATPDQEDRRGRADHAIARLRTVLGGDFRAAPRYTAPPRGDRAQVDVGFPSSAALQGGDAFAATLWFQRLTRIRDGARRLGDTLLYADALGGADPMRFAVAQLPAVANDRWVALPFSGSTPPTGRVSLVAHLPAGPLDPARTLAGLLIEQYTEVLPAPAKTTGLAFHFDQPDATPPQAIVLAVPPVVGADWTLAALEATVRETLELAKLRMVDLNALQDAGHFVPATYLAFNTKGVTVATDLKVGRGVQLG
ncbi:MAG TPA: hypothetical protein VNO30_02730 [Kofleriaceae bacterium]|nr:hypothetical protein [Kofleriaceae bacterium]